MPQWIPTVYLSGPNDMPQRVPRTYYFYFYAPDWPIGRRTGLWRCKQASRLQHHPLRPRAHTPHSLTAWPDCTIAACMRSSAQVSPSPIHTRARAGTVAAVVRPSAVADADADADADGLAAPSGVAGPPPSSLPVASAAVSPPATADALASALSAPSESAPASSAAATGSAAPAPAGALPEE